MVYYIVGKTNLYLLIVTLSTYSIYRFMTVCRRIKIIELSPFFRKKLFLVNNERKRKYKIRIQMKRWTHTKETLSVLMFWDMGLLYAISLALMFLSIRKYFPRQKNRRPDSQSILIFYTFLSFFRTFYIDRFLTNNQTQNNKCGHIFG